MPCFHVWKRNREFLIRKADAPNVDKGLDQTKLVGTSNVASCPSNKDSVKIFLRCRSALRVKQYEDGVSLK